MIRECRGKKFGSAAGGGEVKPRRREERAAGRAELLISVKWVEVKYLTRSSRTLLIKHHLRNEEEHDEDVEFGDLLPNEDGTFQKTATLYATPEEWKKNEYFCLVEHEGNTVWMTMDELKSNYGPRFQSS